MIGKDYVIAFFILFLPLKVWALEWKLSSDLDGVKVWQLNSDSSVTGSLQIRDTSKRLDWSREGKEKFFKSLSERKKQVLALVGVTNWEAKDYHWTTKDDNSHELRVSGSYYDSAGTHIQFKEVHIFQKGKTLQLLQTRPASLKDGLNYEKDFFSFINKEVVNL
jgi:hypothetical protein